MNDPYLILGLWDKKMSGSLDDTAVKTAYQTLLRKYPPEQQPERFKQIRTAFEQLETHKKRLQYELFDYTLPTFEDVVTAVLPANRPQPPSLAQAKKLLKPA